MTVHSRVEARVRAQRRRDGDPALLVGDLVGGRRRGRRARSRAPARLVVGAACICGGDPVELVHGEDVEAALLAGVTTRPSASRSRNFAGRNSRPLSSSRGVWVPEEHVARAPPPRPFGPARLTGFPHFTPPALHSHQFRQPVTADLPAISAGQSRWCKVEGSDDLARRRTGREPPRGAARLRDVRCAWRLRRSVATAPPAREAVRPVSRGFDGHVPADSDPVDGVGGGKIEGTRRRTVVGWAPIDEGTRRERHCEDHRRTTVRHARPTPPRAGAVARPGAPGRRRRSPPR